MSILTVVEGDITSVSVLGSTYVTVHTYAKAVEILDKKSAHYSSRPVFQMFALAGWKDNVAFLPYGQQLRESRKMIASSLNRNTIQTFHQHQENLTKRFMGFLLRTPEHFYDRIEWLAGFSLCLALTYIDFAFESCRYNSSSLLKIVYGYDTLDDNDPMIDIVHDGMSLIGEVCEDDRWIEFIPWRKPQKSSPATSTEDYIKSAMFQLGSRSRISRERHTNGRWATTNCSISRSPTLPYVNFRLILMLS